MVFQRTMLVRKRSTSMKFRALSLVVVIFILFIVPNYSNVIVSDVIRKQNISYEFSAKAFEDPRTKKYKLHLLLPLVVSALLIKSIIFPLIIKAMAVMSSIAVLLSFMSLIISSIIGFAKFAHSTSAPNVKVVYVDKKPLVKKVWTPPEEYIFPSIFRSKFSYVPHDEAFNLGDGPGVVDHYHTFVDK